MTNPAPVSVEMFDAASLRNACQQTSNPLSLYRQACDDARAWLDRGFHAGEDIVELIHLRAAFLDQLLACVWQQFDWQDATIT
ncbi:MAG: hypothetical protein ACE1Y4_11790, partial [Lysobacterales bacterium]